MTRCLAARRHHGPRARLSVRRVILEDTWTAERFELEGARSPDAHVTATMHALSDIDEIAS